MIHTKQIVDGKWVYGSLDRPYQVGDIVSFTCNGAGRGGHYNVTGRVTGVNRKTIDVLEAHRSYLPGTPWRLNFCGGLSIWVELPTETAKSIC